MKTNKYIYYWIIQGWYCYGWEDLSSYDQKEYKRSEVVKDLREYQISDPSPKRIITRRELNEPEGA